MLQVIKRMFEMCNYKIAPYTVATHWATKSVMHYRDPTRCSWYEATVSPLKLADGTTNFEYDLQKFAQKNKHAAKIVEDEAAAGRKVTSMRCLSSVLRGPDQVRLKDWVVISNGHQEPEAAGQVTDLFECRLEDSASSVVRLRVASLKDVATDDDGNIWAVSGPSLSDAIVQFEGWLVEVVVRQETAQRDVFI